MTKLEQFLVHLHPGGDDFGAPGANTLKLPPLLNGKTANKLGNAFHHRSRHASGWAGA